MEIPTIVLEERGAQKSQGHMVRLSYVTLTERVRAVPGVKVKVTQSCLTPCGPMVYTVHGILQARILDWVVFPFSRASSQPRDLTQVSHTAGGFFTS